ncbi:MAG: thioesterase [Ktedonobacteraceae bacterium]|nr:thioesterase [Ktedonobacteraceae bacterium]
MPPRPDSSGWIVCPQPRPAALVRLFCFPYAGGSASLFREWSAFFPREIEVCAIQLPGRENRLAEPPLSEFEPLVQRLADAISPYLDKPCAFFGHSLGALVSFELARFLRQREGFCPVRLLVSAHRAPQLPDPHPPVYDLPLPEFLQTLRGLQGTPEEILHHEELMQLLLPTLRADFTLAETYRYVPDEPLACPCSAFGGLRDSHVSRAELAAWQQQTSSTFLVRMFPGDHFFLHSDRMLLVRAIADELSGYLYRHTDSQHA